MGKFDKEGELSSSQIRTFQRCRRQWYFQYYRKLETPEGESRPVTVGLLIHKALEHLYSPTGVEDPLQMMEELLEEMVKANPFYESEIRSSGELASKMFSNYLEWVNNTYADAGLEIVSAEERIQHPLGETGYILTGRPDARAVRMGLRVPIDHKSVQSLDEIPKTAQLDGQFKTYHLLEYLNDPDTPIDCVMINMFRRVDHTHPTSKPPYFQRYEVRYNAEEIRTHWLHVLDIANQISSVKSRLDAGEDHHLAAPPSPSRSCSWDCRFRMLCSMVDDGSNYENVIRMQYVTGEA